MQIRKSPGGALFPYYYKHGELFGLQIDSYFANYEDPEDAKTWLVSELE